MKKKSLLDELRIYLEGVENYWLAFAVILVTLIALAGATLFGVYLYTRH